MRKPENSVHFGWYLLAGGIATITAAPVPAQAVATDGALGAAQVFRLSPEEKAKLLESGTEAKADAAQNIALGGGFARQIHGEVGAMIGTGGQRSVFGTAAIPIGQNGGAIISFENSRYGRRGYGY